MCTLGVNLLVADNHEGSGSLGLGETGHVACLGVEEVVVVALALVVLEDSDLAVGGGGNVDGVESLSLPALVLGGGGLDGDGLDSGSVAVVGVGENVDLEGVLGVDLVAEKTLLDGGGLGNNQEGEGDDDGEQLHVIFRGWNLLKAEKRRCSAYI